MPTAEETAAVQEYLLSHDAVADLRKRVDVVRIYQRPWLDLMARLNGQPSAERLLRYYRKQIRAEADSATGVVTLTVRTFAPGDSRTIAEALLAQSEETVNRFNERAQADTLTVARSEVARAQQHVEQLQASMASFRQERRSLDPSRSSAMVTQVIGNIEGELAKARAELAVQSSYLQPNNPQLVGLRNRVANLERQAEAQNARLAGGQASIAPTLGDYERLTLEREFADKEYEHAMASLEAARVDAQKKHLFLVRVVQPNLPEKALFPRRALTVLSTFIFLLVSYGIGWLILAGIREHAA
jgi:capsular polysaccharide transport system permease protein